MVMAGLWDEWTDKKTGERVESCTMTRIIANFKANGRKCLRCRLWVIPVGSGLSAFAALRTSNRQRLPKGL
jgi:hypothetical protein